MKTHKTKRREALREALAPRGRELFTQKETDFMQKYNLDPESTCFVFIAKFEPGGGAVSPTAAERKTLAGIRKKLPNMAVVELSKADAKH